MLANGFWLGVGFWAATVAFLIFILITSLITGLIAEALGNILGEGKGGRDGRS